MAEATVVERVTALIAQMGGLTILAATLSAVTAAVYRWYVRELVPRGLSMLVGLSGVAVYLNTSTALGQVIAGSTAPTEVEQALFNMAAFLVAGGGAVVGRRVGDQFGSDVFRGGDLTDVDEDVGRLVKSVGRVIAVELPQDIDDVTGYDPVPAETKSKLAGRTFLFPKRLTLTELRERLIHRLKTDYAVGHVDVELADDGSIEFLGLGSRAAGIGPTLPPATNAVAIRADPAFAASAGDLVQVWETNPMRRVVTAELRGVADETVTVAIDAADTPKLDPTTEYRLVTLPVTDRPDREFASLLRAADETFSSIAVEAGSPLHGLPVGGLDLVVVAVEPEGGQPQTLPEPSYILAPGDIVFAIARPDALRRLERAAEPLDPSVVSRPAASQRPSQPTASTPAQAEQPDARDDQQAAADTTAETTATDTEETSAESADDGEREEDDGTPGGQADAASFSQLKDEFESGDAAWDDTENSDSTTADTERDDTDDTAPTGGKADAGSFAQLKDEFESGDAAWADDEEASGSTAETGVGEDTGDQSETATDDGDDLFGEDAGLEDVTFDASADDEDGDEADDDLAALGGAEADDADEGGEDDEDDEDDGDGASGEDDDDDDDDSGGGTSFQQLKEEFESGDADWEDDISDSPGGDMRLDE